jgi:hypothetical protein
VASPSLRLQQLSSSATGEVAGETPSIAATRFPINKRFELLEFYTEMVAKREQPSLLVTGPGGLGKTYSVLAKLQELGILNAGDCGEVIPPDGDGKNGTLKPSESKKYYTIIKGYSTPKGLYRTLFENQNRLVIFDDCDSVLRDPTALNLLKGALDSYEKRVISWHSESIRDDGLPSSFNFSGSVIFISNYPMHKIDQAVKTRAIPVDLTMSNEQKIERMEVIVQNEQFLPSYADRTQAESSRAPAPAGKRSPAGRNQFPIPDHLHPDCSYREEGLGDGSRIRCPGR